MEAYMLDMTAELDDPKSEAIPVKAGAWGIIDIKDEDGINQTAGISVFVDMGDIAFEVDVPVAEALACLFRATNSQQEAYVPFGTTTRMSFETNPDNAPMFNKSEIDPASDPAGFEGEYVERVLRGVQRQELNVGEAMERLGFLREPCPECGPNGCVDVEDLI